MLLIAQPKSGSTSLMRTISYMANIHYKNGQTKRKNDIKCEGFEETQKYHGTTVKRTKKYLQDWIINKKTIYKEHILPTEDHIEKIKQIKGNFVVLIRNPVDVISSYKRVFKVLPEMKKIDYDNLYEEMKDFYNIYNNLELNNCLVVNYFNLIKNFQKVINDVLDHYDLKKIKNLNELLKYNYSGVKHV